ncbi:MAG: glycosyl hydrolase [Clostridia bacterium]|nr:glycosyl hydrolase [Clostridia bacterium]
MLDLCQIFKEGNLDYAPATMWFFNDEMTEAEITYNLEAFKASGGREFYIHPMYGLRGDYLDQRFMELIQYVVRESARLDLVYWIYDEYNWPSGVAGGYLLRDMPWARMSGLELIAATVKKGEVAEVKLSDTTVEYLGAFVEGVGSVTAICTDNVVTWKNDTDTDMTLCVFESALYDGIGAYSRWAEFAWGQRGYLDTLDEDAVQLFIKHTHERYKDCIGDYFGTVVKGVFTDEVAACKPTTRAEATSLPWSRKFKEAFQKKNGYDITNYLPSLFFDTANYEHIRTDYWDTVSYLYNNNYMRLTSEWCEENNLIYTGHCLVEETVSGQIAYSGDFWDCMNYFHMPGIDTIFSYQHIDDYNFNLPGKLVCSIARQQGKSRILAETYTGSGWDMTLRQMKRIANRLFILGVNYIQYMGAYYSIAGFRKSLPGGYPPSHNWNNTLYKHYASFNRYASGIQYFLDKTEYTPDILVLYPYATAKIFTNGYALWNKTAPSIYEMKQLKDNDMNYEDCFNMTVQGITNALLDLHIPFEFALEQPFAEAKVYNGELHMSNRKYKKLIIPASSYLTIESWKVIEDFISAGGKTVFVNCRLEKSVDNSIPTDLDELIDKENVAALECFDFDTVPGVGETKKGSPSCFTNSLRNMLGAGICDADTGVLSAPRCYGDQKYLLLANDTESLKAVRGRGKVRTFNTQTGDTAEIYGWKLTLQAYETVVLEFLDEDNWTLLPRDMNWFVPDAYQINDDGKLIYKSKSWYVSETEMMSGVGIDSNTVTAEYRFVLDDVPDVLELVTEDEYPVQWQCNGIVLPKGTRTRIWHKDNIVTDIAPYCVHEENVLTVTGVYPPYQAPFGIPFAALRGNFRVFADKITLKAGNNDPYHINEQGYPYYAGDFEYKKSFYLEQFQSVKLSLNTNDAVKVYINDHDLGSCLWEPYEFDLTPFCQPGINTVSIVFTVPYGGLFHKPTLSGAKEPPTIFISQIPIM